MIPVTLMMAMTADGKIARDDKHFPDWTSPEDKRMFAEVSREFGVIIVGRKTFDTLQKPLPDRLNVVYTADTTGKPETGGVRWVSGNPAAVLDQLELEGYNKALLVGGAGVNSLFLKNKLITEIILTIEPVVFGEGLSLFTGSFGKKLKLSEVRKINGDTVVLRYQVM